MIRSAQPTLHGHDAAAWRHSHRFVEARPRAERRTLYAVLLTAAMMVAEILGGWWTGSMALLADGWHMSTHVLALGIALAAYVIARRLGEDPRFTFGTWKIEILGSFASALLLGVVGVLVVVESVQHLLAPVDIHYNEALWVTAIGLAVNVVCALWLAGAHDHDHGHDHAHGPAGTRRHDDDHDRDKERNKERDDTHEHETPTATTTTTVAVSTITSTSLNTITTSIATGIIRRRPRCIATAMPRMRTRTMLTATTLITTT